DAVDGLEDDLARYQCAGLDPEMHFEIAHLDEWSRRHAMRSRPGLRCSRWHALRRPAPAGRTAGSSVLQRSKRQEQRSWKAQPEGKCCRSGGWPEMVRNSAVIGSSSRGVERNKPCV